MGGSGRREVGTQARDPREGTGASSGELSLPTPRVCVSRKLEPGVRAGNRTRYQGGRRKHCSHQGSPVTLLETLTASNMHTARETRFMGTYCVQEVTCVHGSIRPVAASLAGTGNTPDGAQSQGLGSWIPARGCEAWGQCPLSLRPHLHSRVGMGSTPRNTSGHPSLPISAWLGSSQRIPYF